MSIILFIIVLISFIQWRRDKNLAEQIAEEIDRKAKENQNQYNLIVATRRGDDMALAIRLKNSPHMRKPHHYASYPDDSPIYLKNVKEVTNEKKK